MAEYEISVKTKEEVKKIITIMLDRKNASVSGEIFELSEENARELARSILNELREGYTYVQKISYIAPWTVNYSNYLYPCMPTCSTTLTS